jgi:predicted permease
VLLIACANVTNLLLARGTRQRRATSVRLALGVGRARIVGQTMLESVALAMLGGVLALALARWGGAFVRSTLLPDVSFPDATVSPQVIGFVALTSLLAGLVAGVGPAFISSRLDVRGDLVDASRGHTGSRSGLRRLLTATQAALSVVLLVGAGLFVASLRELRGLDLGMDTRRLLVVQYEFESPGPDPLLRKEIYDEAVRRVATLAGVEAVASTATPFSVSYAVDLRVLGRDSLPRFPGGGPYVNSISPGYFETAGLRITRGRGLAESDGPGDPKVAVVSETMASLVWPDEEALGRCFFVTAGPRQDECVTVVGVVEDAARQGFRDGPSAAYYVHFAQMGEGAPRGPAASAGLSLNVGGVAAFLSAPNALYLRAEGDPAGIRAAVASALRQPPPMARWTHVYPMSDTLDRQARSWTLGATMFTIFGLLALIVAAVGLYSVLAFDVAQRTRELGIRTALGARKSRLLRAVISQGVLVGGVGVALGLGAAYLAAPYVQDLLFETSPRDGSVYATVALVLLAVSVAASLLPALRATRVDPMTALRAD